ncbi:MAG: histidinol-phosphatase HisJ family protein [Candidatus Syntrophosphaera sp.]|nr:histidinol-phosphatase HisJ family protein [Candidatus Syntrophosphaera sp.]
MKADYHIHTQYSCDSNLKAESLVDKAISLNYDLIAITEHLDLLPQELARFGLPSFAQYSRHIDALRASHASSPLRIVMGVEVGDFQRVKPQADTLLEQIKPELVLGAVHFLSDHSNVAVPLKKPLTPAQITDYYTQNLELVKTCDIHALAHLGVYKRYYTQVPDESHCEGLLKEIFQAMIERQIALEINFSALRKPYLHLLPESPQIELYRSLGGDLFTIGSDTHLLEHFDLGYGQLPAWLFSGEVRFPL